jgi:hypothetical protein
MMAKMFEPIIVETINAEKITPRKGPTSSPFACPEHAETDLRGRSLGRDGFDRKRLSESHID